MLRTKDVSFEHSVSFQLNGVNLNINQGEIVSLVGPNGSGKSTLLRLISRLIKPKEGEIILDGSVIDSMKSKDVAKKLAMLPQMQEQQSDLTVQELIEFGRYPHRKSHSRLAKEDEEIIQWAIEVTNLTNYKNRMLHSLSGGERQRAWIALAIAQRPKILLLDEPTTFLDIAHQLDVMELVQQLNKQFGMTVLMVLHDINQAARYSNRLVVMKNGNIHYDGIPQCVLCREMFQSIFQIDATIHKQNGNTFFTPLKL
ncbi:ABC transporter ATP-binding protein [Virgibacillus alimentarius]|uniref:Iron complex transport system ATP-binding protein n=1 Tax=Virgibacillus alimentarius TaxID=698769 RepID=A0ABS4SAW2_9BACI|nr:MULTISPECIES: ABC transporter ATP-binding protein [Virgibacillus]MBP2258630.1 iron complex transport system ATP-binding protein [Virgibacillus alimentarius]HLR66620.1 ABC transporter ATP-binding protein [Virgibacillus sp.]